MAFGLTIGTERATALQNSIQDELMKRGYSAEADAVMAEYITIMIINNKTPAQISSELEDLIGSEFDSSFVDWLFAEVAKTAPEADVPAPAPAEPAPAATSSAPARESPPHLPTEPSRRPPNGPRAGPLYQHALAQALPSTSPSAQKRSASARSPSPGGHPHKSRRTDLPTGPRAMQHGGGPSGSRSLLERMSSPRNGGPYPKDDIQARIDNITANNPEMAMMMGGAPGGFPMNGMPGMDMAAMAGMTNPIMFQEMMMNQMALMTQMAGAMGILNPAAMGMNAPFPMQPGMDMNMMNAMAGQQHGMDGRGRGRGRGGMRGGRGRGGHAPMPSSNPPDGPSMPSAPNAAAQHQPPAAPTPVVAAPTPVPAPQITPSVSQGRPGFAPPERPQSPTLCKFALKCTNPGCRYSHPSPVATPESGVVLSNEACENGKDCKDKDCIKAHVSPAVLKGPSDQLNPKAPVFTPASHPSPAPSHQSTVPCRFGAACTRPGCTFAHPHQKQPSSIPQPCRFGTACTKATCPFQHPEGRVLPSTFHRGLGVAGGLTNVATPETGSIGAASHNRSMTFNAAKPGAAAANGSAAAQSAAELEKKVKEVEEKKLQAQQAVAEAQAAAAAGKKEDAKPVTISA